MGYMNTCYNKKKYIHEHIALKKSSVKIYYAIIIYRDMDVSIATRCLSV